MPQPWKLTTAVAVAGLVGLASAAPLSTSEASELQQLDEVQLDTVTAGRVGFSLDGTQAAGGTVQTRTSSLTTLTGNASPVAAVGTGITVNQAVAIGGAAPFATTSSTLGPPLDPDGNPLPDENGNPLTGPVGFPLVIIPINIQQGIPGAFAVSVDALAVAYVSTQFPGLIGF